MTNALTINTQFTIAIAKAVGKYGAQMHAISQFCWDNGVRTHGWTKTDAHVKVMLRAMLDKGLISAKTCTVKGKKSAFITLTEQGCAVVRNLTNPMHASAHPEPVAKEELHEECPHCGDVVHTDQLEHHMFMCVDEELCKICNSFVHTSAIVSRGANGGEEVCIYCAHPADDAEWDEYHPAMESVRADIEASTWTLSQEK